MSALVLAPAAYSHHSAGLASWLAHAVLRAAVYRVIFSLPGVLVALVVVVGLVVVLAARRPGPRRRRR